MRRRIVVRRDDAEHHIALTGKLVIIGEVAGADDLDVGLVESALDELARERTALLAREIDERGVRCEIANALEKWREIRISERYLQLLDHLPAAGRERVRERGFRFSARRPIVDQRHNSLAAVLGRPFAHDHRGLPERET